MAFLAGFLQLGIVHFLHLGAGEGIACINAQLKEACEKCHIFSKLSPYQKQRVVKAFQSNGHIVGYMGRLILFCGARAS